MDEVLAAERQAIDDATECLRSLAQGEDAAQNAALAAAMAAVSGAVGGLLGKARQSGRVPGTELRRAAPDEGATAGEGRPVYLSLYALLPRQRAARGKRRPASQGLVALSVNATCWASLLGVLADVDRRTLVIAAQEVNRLPSDVAAASKKLLGMGWKSFWAPSVVGEGGGTSAGVLLLVRAWLDAWAPGESAQLVEGRLVHCLVRCSGLGTWGVYSLYAKHGVGLKGNQLLFDVAVNHAREMGLPCLVLGDWNLDPEVVAGSVGKGMLGQLLVPRMPTCVTESAETFRDFGVAGVRLLQAVSSVVTDLSLPVPLPHRAVRFEFHGGAAERTVLVVPRGPGLPADAPCGPKKAPLDCRECRACLAEALAGVDHAAGTTATGEPRKRGIEALNLTVFPAVQGLLRAELGRLFDKDVEDLGLVFSAPQPVQRKVGGRPAQLGVAAAHPHRGPSAG